MAGLIVPVDRQWQARWRGPLTSGQTVAGTQEGKRGTVDRQWQARSRAGGESSRIKRTTFSNLVMLPLCQYLSIKLLSVFVLLRGVT